MSSYFPVGNKKSPREGEEGRWQAWISLYYFQYTKSSKNARVSRFLVTAKSGEKAIFVFNIFVFYPQVNQRRWKTF